MRTQKMVELKGFTEAVRKRQDETKMVNKVEINRLVTGDIVSAETHVNQFSEAITEDETDLKALVKSLDEKIEEIWEILRRIKLELSVERE